MVDWKKVVLYYKSTFFQVGEKWLTRKKEEPLFYTFPEMRSQNKRSSETFGTEYFFNYTGGFSVSITLQKLKCQLQQIIGIKEQVKKLANFFI